MSNSDKVILVRVRSQKLLELVLAEGEPKAVPCVDLTPAQNIKLLFTNGTIPKGTRVVMPWGDRTTVEKILKE